MESCTTAFLRISAHCINLTKSGLSNYTTPTTTRSGNNLMPSVTLIFAVATMLLNGLILAAFIRRPNLRTPFNTYVINLAVIDVLIALFPMSMNIQKQLLGRWPYNGLLCTIILLFCSFCNAANRAAHLLIAANRMWAVTFPLSYRSRHTKQLAVGGVLLAWSLTMCFVTPEIIIARRHVNYSLTAADPSCAVETTSYKAYHLVYNITVFNLPEVIILTVYPCLVLKLRKKLQNQVRIHLTKSSHQGTIDSASAALGSNAQPHRTTLETDSRHVQEAEGQATTATFRLRSSLAPSSHSFDVSHQGVLKDPGDIQSVRYKLQEQDQEEDIEARTAHSQPNTASRSVRLADKAHTSDQANFQVPGDMEQSKGHMQSRAHNRLFAYLVLAVICCWTPNHVFFLMAQITDFWNVQFYTVEFFLSFANSWLNPILIYLADTRIRTTVNELIRFW